MFVRESQNQDLASDPAAPKFDSLADRCDGERLDAVLFQMRRHGTRAVSVRPRFDDRHQFAVFRHRALQHRGVVRQSIEIHLQICAFRPFIVTFFSSEPFPNHRRTESERRRQHADQKIEHEMIFNQYKEALTKLGVTPIDCVGKEFDPERHNAVMHIEDESCGENTVVEVLQQGFMLGDKVLRFAIVKVAN